MMRVIPVSAGRSATVLTVKTARFVAGAKETE